ncbi:MAG: DNA polymerase III subunit gamma/tau [Deltaproteobacteria bacterium]|nr:DNA polymerase III subunit gamma/tau [Deltaproteobacteria bacterium]
MSYLVLARKYRPQSFEEVIGQEHVTRTLQNAIQSDRVAHALIFAGPRGVGKTSVARILAKALNCKKGPTTTPCNNCDSCREITDGITVDVFEIDGASNRGINEIRELRENIKYMPSRSRNKIYIIDEVHMLTKEAFNALLKTLEEPPEHVIFIFATTELHKVPITIQSRCQIYNFKRINSNDIVGQLKNICNATGIEVSEEIFWIIAREAEGGMRDALSLLDQIIAYSEDSITDEQVLDILGVVDRKRISDMATAILTNDVIRALELLDDLYSYGHDIKRLYGLLVEHFRNLLLVKMNKNPERLVDLPHYELENMKKEVEGLSLETINQLFQSLFKEESSVRLALQPKLAVEMALISLAQLKPVVSVETIIEKLDMLQKTAGDGRRDPVVANMASEPATTYGETADAPTSNVSHSQENKTQEQDCQNIWKELLKIFEQKYPSFAPCLEKSVLQCLEKEKLTIAINGNGFLAKRIQDKKDVIQSVCDDFFKQKMSVKITALPAGADSGSGQETDYSRHLKKKALNNPILMETLEVFGGRVVDVKLL